MSRSKISAKLIALAGGAGLLLGAFGELPTAAAQSYSDEYSCPAGFAYDPSYGCTLSGDAYEPYDFGYYGYLPYGTYGPYYGEHREFGHGLGHGMGSGFGHGVGIAHPGGGFGHDAGIGHGMAGGIGHAGGGGHR
jgi:hypothetical protein